MSPTRAPSNRPAAASGCPTVDDNETFLIMTNANLEPDDETRRLYVIDVYALPDGALEAVFLAPAWLKSNTQGVLWCPFCACLHEHGRAEHDRLHRIAHCAVNEPGSYFLHPLPGPRPTRRPRELADIARATQLARRRDRR